MREPSVRGLISARRIQLFSALAIYLLLSVWLFGRGVIFDPARTYVGVGPDPSQYMWALVWWPHALAHRLNPFVVPVVWAPAGFNLAWTTSIPALALLVCPVTRILGPVVAYNLLCLLAPMTAAWTAFILCHYIVRSFWPAFIGGYLFGFSSYMVGHMAGHLDLVTIFPVPLVLLLVLLRLDEVIGLRAFILTLTVALGFQFLSSPEVFTSMTFFGAMAIFSGLMVLPPKQRKGLWQALLPISGAYLATAALVAPYLYFMLAPGEPAPLNPAHLYSTDLLNFVLPTSAWLGAHTFFPVTARFVGNFAEDGAYLGIPLLLIIYLCARARWERSSVRLLICCLLFISLASLGPVLHVAGVTIVPLPWMFFVNLPLIDQALPARFAVHLSLVAAIIAAIYLSSVDVNRWARVLLGGLAVLFIWPLKPSASKVDTPAFFSSGMYRRYLAENDTVILLPYGDTGNSLLWQAQTDMYFRMAGGYMNPRPSEFWCWPVLNSLYSGHPAPQFAERLRLFLSVHGVKAILVARPVQDSWLPVLSRLGITPLEAGDMLLYSTSSARFDSDTELTIGDKAMLRLEVRNELRRYAALILAADKYVSQRLPTAKLTPWEAERLDLLTAGGSAPPARSGPGVSGNWQDDLWLGPWRGGGIGVGIVGCRRVLESLSHEFGPYATTTYFPYFPFPYRLVRRTNQDFGQLLIVFSPASLHRAAQAAQPVLVDRSSR